jgi:hypothetical protein
MYIEVLLVYWFIREIFNHFLTFYAPYLIVFFVYLSFTHLQQRIWSRWGKPKKSI